MIPTENHLILPEDLFGLNRPKQLDMKLLEKKMGLLPFLSPADAPEWKKERGRRRGGGSSGSEGRVAAGGISVAALTMKLT
jgi:hypothetical protein